MAATARRAPFCRGIMGNPSVNKRQKERSRQDKQREKDAKRKQRREDKSRAPGGSSLDDAIAHIVPGPQPEADESES
jgi:hypothetical protein